MALQDISSYLNYPLQENLDVGGSGDNMALSIEKFNGTVHETIQKDSILSGVFQWRPLVGTDTMSNAAMGNPILQAVVAGVEPEGKTIETGKMIVQVKTPIIARVTEGMLAAVQDHLDIKSRTPANFGKKIAKHIDEVLFVQGNKCIQYEHDTLADGTDTTITGYGTGGILVRGTQVDLDSASDETDEDKLDAGVMSLHQALAENDLDPTTDGYLYMAPEQYFTLLKNDKLISVDYSAGNGNYANATIYKASGIPIKMTNRLNQTQNDASSGGTTTNEDSVYELYGSAYSTTAAEAKIVAAYLTGQSLMVAQAIPLTSKVYWDDRVLTWFIDSYLCFGAAPDRTDLVGGIYKA